MQNKVHYKKKHGKACCRLHQSYIVKNIIKPLKTHVRAHYTMSCEMPSSYSIRYTANTLHIYIYIVKSIVKCTVQCAALQVHWKVHCINVPGVGRKAHYKAQRCKCAVSALYSTRWITLQTWCKDTVKTQCKIYCNVNYAASTVFFLKNWTFFILCENWPAFF